MQNLEFKMYLQGIGDPGTRSRFRSGTNGLNEGSLSSVCFVILITIIIHMAWTSLFSNNTNLIPSLHCQLFLHVWKEAGSGYWERGYMYVLLVLHSYTIPTHQ